MNWVTDVLPAQRNLSPLEASSIYFPAGMMRCRSIAHVTPDIRHDGGFDGWWSPVDNLPGCIEGGGGQNVLRVQTLPWDGATGGRFDPFVRCTDRKDNPLVRGCVAEVNSPTPIVSECLKADMEPFQGMHSLSPKPATLTIDTFA